MSALTSKELYSTLSSCSWKKWFSFSSGIKALVVTLFVCTLVTSQLISSQVQNHFIKVTVKERRDCTNTWTQESCSLSVPASNPREFLETNVHVCLCSSPFPPLCHLEWLGGRKALKAQVHEQLGFSNWALVISLFTNLLDLFPRK